MSKGYCKRLVLRLCGVSSSAYYKNTGVRRREEGGREGLLLGKAKRGRPYPGYSKDIEGERVSDERLAEILKSYRGRLEFGNWGGCKVLSRYLLRDYGLIVNKRFIGYVRGSLCFCQGLERS